MSAHPSSFTAATVATAIRHLGAVRDGLRERACTFRDPNGELVPLLGNACLAIEALEKAMKQLEGSDA